MEHFILNKRIKIDYKIVSVIKYFTPYIKFFDKNSDLIEHKKNLFLVVDGGYALNMAMLIITYLLVKFTNKSPNILK